jgi:hypothetical protein
MLIVEMSEVKLPGEAKQNNLPPECGKPIDVYEHPAVWIFRQNFINFIHHHESPKAGYINNKHGE